MATDNVEVQFSADTSNLQSGLNAAASATKQAGAEMQTAAQSGATPLSQALNTVQQTAQSVSSALTPATSGLQAQAEAATKASHAHKNLGEAVGLNRMQMMELGHSARSMVDMLSAGMPVTRAFGMELPRIAQVLMGMGPAAMGAAVAIGGFVAAVAMGIGRIIEFNSAVKGLEDTYFSMGNASSGAMAGQVKFFTGLAHSYDQTVTSVTRIGQILATIPGMATPTQNALQKVVQEMAGIKNEDPEKVATELAKVFTAGGHSVDEFMRRMNISTEVRGQIKDLYAANEAYKAQDLAISTLTRKFSGFNDQLKQRRENEAAIAAASMLTETGQTAEDIGLHVGDERAARQDRMPMESPEHAAQAEDIEQYNKVKREQIALDRQIVDLEKAVAESSKSGSDEEKKAAQSALDNARLRRQQLVDPATRNSLEQELLQLHAQADAAQQGSQIRVQAAEKEAEAIKGVYGEESTQYRSAQVKLTAAKKQAADEQLRITLEQLRGEEALARDDYGRKVAIQGQILAAMRAAGKEGTSEYQSELNRRNQLAQQGADHAFMLKQEELRREIEAERSSTQRKLALVAQYVQDVARYYGVSSQQYQQAKNFELQVTRQVEEQKRQEQQKTIDAQVRSSEQAEQAGLRKLDYERQLGQISAAEELQRQRALADQSYQTELDLLNRKRQIAGLTELDQRQIDQRIEQLTQQHAQRIEQIEFQNALRIRSQISSIFGGITGAINSSLTGVMQGTQTLSQSVMRLGQTMAANFIRSIVNMAAKWAENQLSMLFVHQAAETAKTAATTAGTAARTSVETAAAATGMATSAARASTQIGTDAATGAAGAYSAIAAIPYVGPFIAPAAAAAAMAAIMAFSGSVASAAGGWAEVPSDGVMTELHKQEMVLPASLANPLRSAISSWGTPSLPNLSSSNIPAAGPSGDMSLTYAPSLNAPGGGSSPMTAREARSFFKQHSDAMFDVIKAAKRNGRLSKF